MVNPVTAVGIRRRLEGLQTLGYPAEQLAVALGFHQLGAAAVDVICQQMTVTAEVTTAVCDLYDRWSGTLGPCEQTRTTTRAAGMAPPLAWDDDTIDDPTAHPQGIPRRRTRTTTSSHSGTHKPRGPRIDLDDVAHLAAAGLTDEQIAVRLGVQPGSIQQARYRARTRGSGQAAIGRITAAITDRAVHDVARRRAERANAAA
jgi:hypothetical protein